MQVLKTPSLVKLRGLLFASASSALPTLFRPNNELTSDVFVSLSTPPSQRLETDVQIIYKFLMTFPTLSNIPYGILRGVSKDGFFDEFGKDMVLYSFGDTPLNIYIVLKGKVSIRSKESSGELKEVQAFDEGQVFGEFSLNTEKTYIHEAITLKTTSLFRIPRETYFTLQETHSADVAQKMSVIDLVNIFKAWTREEKIALCDVLSYKTYIPNKVIMKQGEETTGMYIIKSGKVKLMKEIEVLPYIPKMYKKKSIELAGVKSAIGNFQQDENGRSSFVQTQQLLPYGDTNLEKSTKPLSKEKEKKILQVGILIAGEYFGERSIIDNSSFLDVSAVSDTHCELFFLSKFDFPKYINVKTINLMKKFGANFPSNEELYEQYYGILQWEKYKKDLVQQILKEKEFKAKK